MAKEHFQAQVRFAGENVSDLERRAARLAEQGKAPKSFLAGGKPLPMPPPAVAHLLLWYHELRRANGRGWRFEPIPFSEILAYGQLFRLEMTPYEVGELRALDTLWLSVQPDPTTKP